LIKYQKEQVSLTNLQEKGLRYIILIYINKRLLLYKQKILKERIIMKQEFHKNAHSGAVYGLGFIGAAIYFISHATGFWIGVLGFYHS
jgi:hypothetical protein